MPSFSLSLSDIKLIWNRLEPLLAEAKHASIWLDIELENEKLIVESVNDLDSALFPAHASTDFTLHCHSSEHSLHLYTALHAGTTPKLVVTSESEVWAAGAREVVLTVINQNKVWHHWLRPNFVAALLLLCAAISVFSVTFVKARNLPYVGATIFGAIGTLAVLGLLYLGRTRVLPMATLRLRHRQILTFTTLHGVFAVAS